MSYKNKYLKLKGGGVLTDEQKDEATRLLIEKMKKYGKDNLYSILQLLISLDYYKSHNTKYSDLEIPLTLGSYTFNTYTTGLYTHHLGVKLTSNSDNDYYSIFNVMGQ